MATHWRVFKRNVWLGLQGGGEGGRGGGGRWLKLGGHIEQALPSIENAVSSLIIRFCNALLPPIPVKSCFQGRCALSGPGYGLK
jgi:hypothetical protein